MLRSRTPKIQPIIAPAIESLEEEHNNQLLNLASEDDRQLSLGDDLIKILQIRRLVKSLEDKSRNRILNPARLPVPPPRHTAWARVYSQLYASSNSLMFFYPFFS